MEFSDIARARMQQYSLTEGQVAFTLDQGPPAYTRRGVDTYRAILPDGRHMKVQMKAGIIKDAFTHQPPTGE